MANKPIDPGPTTTPFGYQTRKPYFVEVVVLRPAPGAFFKDCLRVAGKLGILRDGQQEVLPDRGVSQRAGCLEQPCLSISQSPVKVLPRLVSHFLRVAGSPGVPCHRVGEARLGEQDENGTRLRFLPAPDAVRLAGSHARSWHLGSEQPICSACADLS